MTRRQVLQGAAATAIMCVLDCEPVLAQVKAPAIQRALDDPSVSHGLVEFQGGEAKIGGYLARPKRDGKFPVVIVVTGSSLTDEYIENTAAMLAQAGFVGFVPDIFALQKDEMSPEEKRRVFADQITDNHIYADLDAAIAYLKTQPFVRSGKLGIMGFCFGGRCALMYATHCPDIAAVAPFYGNLKTPEFAKRTKDPIDVPAQIRVPVMGHYSKQDSEIPMDQLAQFESAFKRNHTSVKFYTYDAPHGFFAYNHSKYDDRAAKESWKRTREFFRKYLVEL